MLADNADARDPAGRANSSDSPTLRGRRAAA